MQKRINTIEERIGDLLISFGIYPNLHGFYYIIDFVKIYSSGNQKSAYIYAQIAKRHDTTAAGVERCIRHAFSKLNFEKEDVVQFFGERQLSNTEYINIIVWKLKKEGDVANENEN